MSGGRTRRRGDRSGEFPEPPSPPTAPEVLVVLDSAGSSADTSAVAETAVRAAARRGLPLRTQVWRADPHARPYARTSAFRSQAGAGTRLLVIGHDPDAAPGAFAGGAGLDALADAACPVLVVGRGGTPDGPVIVGVGDPFHCAPVLDAGFDEAAAEGRLLRIVHPWRYRAGELARAVAFGSELREEDTVRSVAFSAAVARAAERRPGVTYRLEVPYGRPAAALLDAAAAASLLVVGTAAPAGRRARPDAALAEILDAAACPVLVVPLARDEATVPRARRRSPRAPAARITGSADRVT